MNPRAAVMNSVPSRRVRSARTAGRITTRSGVASVLPPATSAGAAAASVVESDLHLGAGRSVGQAQPHDRGEHIGVLPVPRAAGVGQPVASADVADRGRHFGVAVRGHVGEQVVLDRAARKGPPAKSGSEEKRSIT